MLPSGEEVPNRDDFQELDDAMDGIEVRWVCDTYDILDIAKSFRSLNLNMLCLEKKSNGYVTVMGY